MLSTLRPVRALVNPFSAIAASRKISTTQYLRAAGYGDTPMEKATNPNDNSTGHNKNENEDASAPSSQPDPHPQGKGKGTGSSSGMTDPEVGKKTGNAGGQKGAGDKMVTEKETRETKKIGSDPKKEEVGGAGVIGG